MCDNFYIETISRFVHSEALWPPAPPTQRTISYVFNVKNIIFKKSHFWLFSKASRQNEHNSPSTTLISCYNSKHLGYLLPSPTLCLWILTHRQSTRRPYGRLRAKGGPKSLKNNGIFFFTFPNSEIAGKLRKTHFATD